MRLTTAILALALVGCSADDRLAILEQTFELKPGAKDTWTFIVYSEGPAYVDALVTIEQGTASVEISEDGKPPIPGFSAAAVEGRKSFAGNLAAGAYLLTVRNTGSTRCVVHLLVVKDLEARP